MVLVVLNEFVFVIVELNRLHAQGKRTLVIILFDRLFQEGISTMVGKRRQEILNIFITNKEQSLIYIAFLLRRLHDKHSLEHLVPRLAAAKQQLLPLVVDRFTRSLYQFLNM